MLNLNFKQTLIRIWSGGRSRLQTKILQLNCSQKYTVVRILRVHNMWDMLWGGINIFCMKCDCLMDIKTDNK